MKSQINVEATQSFKELVNNVIDNSISGEEIKNILGLSSQRLWNKRKGKDKFSDVEVTQIKEFVINRISKLAELLNVEVTQDVEATQGENVEVTQTVIDNRTEEAKHKDEEYEKWLSEQDSNTNYDSDELPY